MTVLAVVVLGLFQHDLLHRVQVSIRNLLRGFRNILQHQVAGNLLLIRIGGSDGCEHEHGLVAIQVNGAFSTDAVGSTLLLADGTVVDTRQNLFGNIHQYHVLLGVGHLVVEPDFGGLGLRCLHLTGEVAYGVALEESTDILSLCGCSLRHRGDILLQQITHLLLVEITNDGVDKLSAIAIQLLYHLQRTVVVKTLDIVHAGGEIQEVAAVLHTGHRVAIYNLVVQVLIFQGRLHHVDKRSHRLLVFLYIGHRQVE